MDISNGKPLSSSRREAILTIGSFGMLTLLGSAMRANAAAVPAGIGNCTLIPTETEGPFPLLSVLKDSAMVRRDIREGKTGVPLRLVMNLQDVRGSCAPIPNAAVYIWHCDKDGEYSGYNAGPNGNHRGETFLRGLQVSDANGQVSFTTIYPGWYPGRITHIHFQIYLNDDLRRAATVTSQLVFPDAMTNAVYRNPIYTRGQNASVKSIRADAVFSDGADYQIAAVSGDANNGVTATLNVGIRS